MEEGWAGGWAGGTRRQGELVTGMTSEPGNNVKETTGVMTVGKGPVPSHFLMPCHAMPVSPCGQLGYSPHFLGHTWSCSERREEGQGREETEKGGRAREWWKDLCHLDYPHC